MTDDADKARDLSDIRSEIESTRERLAQTLDEIEERLDVPKRAKRAVADGRAWAEQTIADGRTWFDAQRQQNPALVYGAVSYTHLTLPTKA